MKDPVTPLAVAILIAAALFSPAAAADQRAPVVIELFTSQGCSSCPPADAVLGELSERADVLPLSFHVTYWDRLGWPDSFGLEAATARQETYATSLGLRGLYTPQMVIGGRIDVVGSSRSRVLRAIDLLATHREPGPAITVQDGTIRLAGGSQGTATVWLIAFDDAHDVKISRGENAGRTLATIASCATSSDSGVGRACQCSWGCLPPVTLQAGEMAWRSWCSGRATARF